MKKPENMINMLRILKDKVSILKATLSLSSKPTTFIHVAVLRATNLHHPLDPPSVDTILALAHHHRSFTGVLIHDLLQRLHGTHSVYVALKCLLTLHHVIAHVSPPLREQVANYSNGPLFNQSTFRDESDRDTWQLSDWVRWYADVLDYGLLLTRVNKEKKLTSLVGMVEKICGAPDSLHYQKLSLVFELMKLVGEDYRMIMREISARINIFGMKRIENLNDDMLENLLSDLKRVENCKEKVLLMFLNKKKYDGVWELIEEVRRDVEEVKEKRDNLRLVRFQGTESTRMVDNPVDESKSVAVVQGPRVKRWLDVDWNPLVASSA